MRRRFASLLLLALMAIPFSSCGASSQQVTTLISAGFTFIDFIYNDNIFQRGEDTVLLAQDALQLVGTYPQNQSPPANTTTGFTEVAISYLKNGIYAQDVYKVETGKASLGILFDGGRTFESISANVVSIDATQTKQIWIVPLQHATNTVTIKANAGWQNTGIFLVRGKEFKVKYVTGRWTIANGTVATSDAAGQPPNPPKNLICNCGEPLPGYSTQAMIGRIGAGQGNAPLEVGDDFAGVSYGNDFLYLRMNTADQLLPYSAGSVTISVETFNV
ncbi:MAG TPA: hypothetical protein VMV29_13970 [Ktedonobacterales bacterium]|nr:hypothetical protein [Ktedonobacterales bacterium]